MMGDKSDNIEGIQSLGEKTIVKFFPELLEKKVSYQELLDKAEILLKEQKDNTTLKHTTHNNGGYEVSETPEQILELIKKSKPI